MNATKTTLKFYLIFISSNFLPLVLCGADTNQVSKPYKEMYNVDNKGIVPGWKTTGCEYSYMRPNQKPTLKSAEFHETVVMPLQERLGLHHKPAFVCEVPDNNLIYPIMIGASIGNKTDAYSICIPTKYTDDSRLRFVMGHEFGHAWLAKNNKACSFFLPYKNFSSYFNKFVVSPFTALGFTITLSGCVIDHLGSCIPRSIKKRGNDMISFGLKMMCVGFVSLLFYIFMKKKMFSENRIEEHACDAIAVHSGVTQAEKIKIAYAGIEHFSTGVPKPPLFMNLDDIILNGNSHPEDKDRIAHLQSIIEQIKNPAIIRGKKHSEVCKFCSLCKGNDLGL